MSEPTILFGATDGFGAFTGFELVSDTPTVEKSRARALGSRGDEVNHKLHDTKTTFTSVYNCKNDTNSPPTIIGAVVNGRVLTSIKFDTKNSDDANTMTLEGHQHGANAHADTLFQVAHGMTMPKAFGVVDFLGGTLGEVAGLASGSCTIKCQHDDKTDGEGDHLVGDNFDAMIEATTEYTGIPTTGAEAGWDVTSNPTPKTNTSFETSSFSGTKSLILAAKV